jgi:chemotaxis signal transduction protein
MFSSVQLNSASQTNAKQAKIKQVKIKILVFSIDNLTFGAKLDEVLKILPMPSIFKSGEKLLGVTNFEDREVLVVDLYQRVFDRPLPATQGFLLIFDAKATLYGITVPTLPILREIPIADLHPLPVDYRDRDSLGIASHMVQIIEKETLQTVFLLDTSLLLQIEN